MSTQTFTAFPRWDGWLDAIFCECSSQASIALVHQKIFSSYPCNKSQACVQPAVGYVVTTMGGLH